MGNIFGSSEFLHGAQALSQGLLAGQPNATSSGIYQQNEVMREQAGDLAAAEAAAKMEKEKKKSKKSGLLQTAGATLGSLIGGPVGGAIGGTAGAAIGGGDVGQAALQNAGNLAIGYGSQALGDMLMGPGGEVNPTATPLNTGPDVQGRRAPMGGLKEMGMQPKQFIPPQNTPVSTHAVPLKTNNVDPNSWRFKAGQRLNDFGQDYLNRAYNQFPQLGDWGF